MSQYFHVRALKMTDYCCSYCGIDCQTAQKLGWHKKRAHSRRVAPSIVKEKIMANQSNAARALTREPNFMQAFRQNLNGSMEKLISIKEESNEHLRQIASALGRIADNQPGGEGRKEAIGLTRPSRRYSYHVRK